MPQIKKLPPDFDFENIEIYKHLNQANKNLSELNALVYSMPKFQLFLAPLTANEAVKSSEIEQIFTTTIDLLQADLFGEVGGMVKETKNYRDALLSGYKLVCDKKLLVNRVLLQIQAILEPNKSGFRTTMGTYLMNNSGQIVHTPPQSKAEIEDLMADLEQFIHNKSDLDPLLLVAITHYQFESIHPFYDGNGRTGRIIMILQMILYDLIQYPVLFLSGYISNNKKEYYEGLQNVRDNNDWQSWIIYILKGVAQQSKETSQRIIELNKLRQKIKEQLKKDFGKFYQPELLDYLFCTPFCTQTNMTVYLKIHRTTASKYLTRLQSFGILASATKSKEKIYFMPEFIKIMDI